MLKAKKKYTKKELKQDQFVLATMKAKTFVEDHSRQIIYISLGVLAIIFLAIYIMNSRSQAKIDAASLLSTAQEQMRNGEKENAIATFNEIIDQYQGTPAAGHAAFFLGKSYWEEGDLTQAKPYFETFINKYAGKNIMSQAAYAAYADCLLSEKDNEGAAKNYEKAATTDPDFPLSVDYLYSAAQAYSDAGNSAKAKALCQKIIDDYNNPTFKNRAEVLLESLSL